MGALSAPRVTPRFDAQKNLNDFPDSNEIPFKLKAGVKIWAGALVGLNAGFLVPMTTATGRIPVGMAMQTVDNTAGADGDRTCLVHQGIHKWNNSGGDAVVAGDVGKIVFAVDDNTVSHTNGGNTQSAAGFAVQVDSDGVWVLTHFGMQQS